MRKRSRENRIKRKRARQIEKNVLKMLEGDYGTETEILCTGEREEQRNLEEKKLIGEPEKRKLVERGENRTTLTLNLLVRKERIKKAIQPASCVCQYDVLRWFPAALNQFTISNETCVTQEKKD